MSQFIPSPGRNRNPVDEAWRKLSERLAGEPPHPLWEKWSRERPADLTEPARFETEIARSMTTPTPAAVSANIAPGRPLEADASPADEPLGERLRQRLRRRAKRLAALAAVCAVAAVVATPVGNDALAALLQKYRMQNLTVVQEQDLERLFRQMFPDGVTRETANRFGTFSRTSGQRHGEVTVGEAERLLAIDLPEPKGFDAKKDRVYISPAESFTFRLNVGEVNKAMHRLGAEKLLPDSVDGKPVRVEMGESVSMDWNESAAEKDGKWHSLSIHPVPTVTVDPSVPVDEALDAILQFPLLPDELRQNLRQSDALRDGEAPLPLVTRGNAEKVRLGSVDAWIESHESPAYKDRPAFTSYNVYWIRDGYIYTYSLQGSAETRDEELAKAAELIGS